MKQPRIRHTHRRVRPRGERLESRLLLTGLTLVSGFEDVGANLASESYWHGPDPHGAQHTDGGGNTVTTGGFESGRLSYNNLHVQGNGYDTWAGWSFSNQTDATTAGYGNQHSAYAGSGADATRTYAVGFMDSFNNVLPTISRTEQASVMAFETIRITNTTYTALSMRDGDAFAKKFGGTSGNDEDWFLLTITGKDGSNAIIGTVEFYLADFRFADNSQDYIVEQWTEVDLSDLSSAAALEFSLTSSDVGAFGMNTPAYFAVDNVTGSQPTTLGFEDVGAELGNESYWNGPAESGAERPGQHGDTVVDGHFTSDGLQFNNVHSLTYGSTVNWSYSNTTDTETADYSNQYSAVAGSGAGASPTYGVAYYDASRYELPPTISKTPATDRLRFQSLQVTNTTYTAASLRHGDGFAKAFGGASGNDPDWFLLTITGRDAAGMSVGAVDFYLADYRFHDNNLDYIVDTWTEVDLRSLQEAVSLEFSLSSSDTGDFGMNTPAYVAVDKITMALPATTVLDEHLFYNDSSYDRQTPGPTADDDAIDPDKHSLAPGAPATSSNYSSYVHGINGVMVDVTNLANPSALGPQEFAFRTGNSSNLAEWQRVDVEPASITTRALDSDDQNHRITIIWPNGAIHNTWLEVTVRPTSNTGLSAPHTFYFGNAIGDSSNNPLNAITDGFDFASARDHRSETALMDSANDHNRDGRVDGTDLAIVRDHTRHAFSALSLITLPPPAPPVAQLVDEVLARDLAFEDQPALEFVPVTPQESASATFPRARAVDKRHHSRFWQEPISFHLPLDE